MISRVHPIPTPGHAVSDSAAAGVPERTRWWARGSILRAGSLWLCVALVATAALSGATRAEAGDPRRRHHGAVIEPFEAGGSTRYFLTWSSSAATPWEHDIYRSVIHFDAGVLHVDDGPVRFIGDGSDGAQEPVSATIAESAGNRVLTAWEDGSGPTIDVRAQIHQPDGTVLVPNWVVAGGPDSQHSAATSHVGRTFLVAYANETPASPGEEGAVVEVAVLDDQTGAEATRLRMTSHRDDNWWPVTVDDGVDHAFVGWGDGSSFSGSVVAAKGGGVTRTRVRKYVEGMRQYHYQVLWLEELQRFFVLARNRRRGSTACLIDRQGVATFCGDARWPLLREARPAAKWHATAGAYEVVYPTGSRHLGILRVAADEITSVRRIRMPRTRALRHVRWPKTGTSSIFVTDADGRDVWNGDNLVLVLANQNPTDDAVLTPVPIPADLILP